MATEYYARIPFGYNGKNLDRGQITELAEDARNNQALIGLRMFVKFNKLEHGRHKCDTCGAEFITTSHRDDHKRKPDCKDDSQVPTRVESAELYGVEPDNMRADGGPIGDAIDLRDVRTGNL